MKRKKLFLCLSLIIVISLSIVITVYAVSDVGADGGGGSLGSSLGGGGTTKHPPPYFDGVRVSFVRGDGTDIVSQDFIRNEQYENNKNAQVKTTSGCSRPAYSNGKCSLSWNGGVSMSSAARSLDEFQALFENVTLDSDNLNSDRYTFPINVYPKVISLSYTGLFDGLYREKNNLSDEAYDDFIVALFNRMLASLGSDKELEDFLIPGEENKLYDLFLVVEPIEVVQMNKEVFMGTSYELAYEARYNQKGGGFYKKSDGTYPCKGSSTGALCDLASVLRKSSPCKTYLDGNIIDIMKEKKSTILIKNFPDGYYFNNIKIDYNNTKKICENSSRNSRLDPDVATGNYGVGMYVVWISDVYDGGDNDCDVIKEKIGWNTTMATNFENTFATNGVQGIYNLYPSGYIDYTDGSDKVDVKWFVNQCTCYGIYDSYANNNLATYKAQNQTVIDELSGTFGSSDWYVSPPLYKTKGKLIGDKFNAGSFTSYNNTWQAYSDAHNLKWTPITKDYYINSLKCGTKEEYWCTEFETWYEDMRSTYSNLRNYPSIDRIKNSSVSVINSRYKDKLQTMIDAYNVMFYPANGFRWTLELNDSGTNYSYIKNCVNADVASCDSIKEYYFNNKGIVLDDLACDKLATFPFDEYNNDKGTNITGEWFVANCGCNQAVSYNCTPNHDLGTCTTGEDIIYTDSSNGIVEDDYWNNCVFNDYGVYDITEHKWSDKTENLTYFENELGSQYCEVYCIEDLNASLAVPNVYVEAGSRFTWGYSSVNGSRTCKTKSVEWDQFVDELDEANQAIADAYVDWQVEIKMDNITWTRSSSKNCNRTCDEYYPTYPCTDGKGTCGGGCKRSSNKGYTYTPSSTYEEHKVYGEFATSDNDSTSSYCSSTSSRPTWNPAAKKQVYEEAVAYAKSLIEAMKKCYTWDEEKVYEVDPQATIIYSDDINYYYRDELNKNTNYTFDDQSVCVNDNAYQVKGCSGNSCPTTTVQMKNCSGSNRYVMMTREAKTKFTLKDNVFRYVLKSNHLSIHPNDLANHDVDHFTTNYIDLGFSNFPVSFSAPDGVYGSNESQGQFDVEYSNLGHVETGKTMVDTILSGSDIPENSDEEFGKWICQYTVYSDLLPEDPSNPDPDDNGGPGDIDLIYRPIDLYNPFPDIDASRRDTGSNWCDQDGNCSYDNMTVENYIYNNRGVQYNELYELEPMYTFVLNPTIIKEIREYNDENSYSSYTGSLGTTQYFDYVCEEGTGTGCISEYLSYLIDITDAKDRPGTCVDDKFRNANDSDSFYGCRY